jgi:hypothetical protein
VQKPQACKHAAALAAQDYGLEIKSVKVLSTKHAFLLGFRVIFQGFPRIWEQLL